MLRLERQVRTWNEGDTSDPQNWEMSDNFHRRGGILTHPKVIEELVKENRWVAETKRPSSWWPDLHVPEGAMDCAVFRDDEIQRKLTRMADGTEVTSLTHAKKGEYSLRDFMVMMCTKTHFYRPDPKEVQKYMKNNMPTSG